MASFMKQAISYLGLGPDEGYTAPVEQPTRGEVSASEGYGDQSGQSGVTVVERPTAAVSHVTESAPTSAVRRVEVSTAQPFVLMPRMFDDAQQIGDRFKRDQPIILNLQGLDRDTARRLLDFASGLCYARDGEMRKVANAVYMLVPANVVVSDDKHRSFPVSNAGH